jgi:peptidoglycan/LPS O-acetylase OafA/YrhL
MRIYTNLDLLRAVAVLCVVLDHSLKFFGHRILFGVDMQWLGRLGVMFFFVHTCTVLMMSLDRSYGKFSTGKFLGNFYLRRIFRIYPLSIFAIAIVLIFSIPSAEIPDAFTFVQVVPTKTELLSNLLLVQNLHGRSIIGVLWSLPFEVQMYVLLPFIFLLLARRGKLAWLLTIWTAVWIVSYLARPRNLLFLAHFLPGVIAFVLIRKVKQPRMPAWIWPLFIGSLIFLFLAISPSFVTGGIVCLVLALSLPYFHDLNYRPLNMVTHNIAKYSYGVYLSHMFCLWFAFIHLRLQPVALRSLVLGGLLIGVPVLLFHLLEDPCIRAGSSLANHLFASKRESRRESNIDLRTEELEETASGL